MLIFDVSVGIGCSSFCAAHENRDELIALGSGRWNLATMAKSLAANDFEPDHPKIITHQSSLINQKALENFRSHHVCSFPNTRG